MTSLFVLAMVPAGAFAAQKYGIGQLFLGLGIVLAFVVMPMFFIVVLLNYKKENV